MGSIALNNRLLESYLLLLAHLDNNTKKKLIKGLTKSLSSQNKPMDTSFFVRNLGRFKKRR